MATERGGQKDEKQDQTAKKNKRVLKQKEKQAHKENMNLEVPEPKRSRRMATPFEAK